MPKLTDEEEKRLQELTKKGMFTDEEREEMKKLAEKKFAK